MACNMNTLARLFVCARMLLVKNLHFAAGAKLYSAELCMVHDTATLRCRLQFGESPTCV